MKKIIMIVDDDQTQAQIIETIFKENPDYDIISVNSGKDCLNILEKGTVPDIILLDIIMPEMSGFSLGYELRQHPIWKDIPILFLTASMDDYTKKSCKILGDDFISKPFDIEDLKKRVERILEKDDTDSNNETGHDIVSLSN